MIVNAKKQPWKILKGTWKKDNIVGHKVASCNLNKFGSTGNSGRTRHDISMVTCHTCNRKRYTTNKCLSRMQYSIPLSTLFVGVCAINSPSDTLASTFDKHIDDWCPYRISEIPSNMWKKVRVTFWSYLMTKAS